MGDLALDDVLARLGAIPPAVRNEIAIEARQATADMVFVPSPGPQTEAYLSEADVLLFGGSPGGGKTALGLGLALNEHHRALVVRRSFVDLGGPLHTLDNIVGQENCYVGGNRPVYRKPGGGLIEFIGLGESFGSRQGNPMDLLYIDEAAQIPEDHVRMLIGWLRSDREGQRKRVVLGSNPPLDSTGDWLITYFAPWLDKNHPNPAAEGELRWFLPTEDGRGDRECEPGETMLLNGVEVTASSRTFISSRFTDNPFYDPAEYAKSLANLPPEARAILMSGNFLENRPDDLWQTIPTEWVRAAQQRWKPQPPAGVPMCAIGVDIAQGGGDNTVLAIRHDGWYAPLIVTPGKDTPDGKTAAGVVIRHRHDDAKPIVDVGGGWGADCYAHLRENKIDARSYMGVKPSLRRTRDGQHKFFNTRSAAYWQFREALDPSQPQGSSVMLPQNVRMVAGLCAPRYEITSNGIKVESKESVKERLGYSPDEADAVVMAWYDGLKQINVEGGWEGRMRRNKPRVILGYAHTRS